MGSEMCIRDMINTGWGGLYYGRVPVAGVFDRLLERTFLFRWYVPVDYRGCGNGFYGAGSGALDVPPV